MSVKYEDSVVPEELDGWRGIEELMFIISEKNIKEIKEKVQECKYKDSIFNLIIIVARVRRFSFSLLAEVISLIPNYEINVKNCEFTEYLLKKGLLKEEQIRSYVDSHYTADQIEACYSDKSSLLNKIRNDSIDDVSYMATESSFFRRKINFGGHELSLFAFAAYCGSANIIKYFLLNHVRGDALSVSYAIRGGNPEIIYLMEQSGYKFNNCLMYAIEYHKNDVAQWLTENYVCESISLHSVIPFCNTVAFSYFFFTITDANKVENGNSPLIVAVKEGILPYVEFLVKQGGDPTSIEKYKGSPLTIAASLGYVSIVKYLLTTKESNEVTYASSQNPFFAAAKNGQKAVIQLLLDSGSIIDQADEYKNTPLMIAAEDRKAEVVRFLIEKGANINLANSNNETALFRAAKEGDAEIVKCLLECHADPDKTDAEGRTPLLIASLITNSVDTVRYLIRYGANINAKSKCGWNALIAATIGNHVDTLIYLLEHGADLKQPDNDGKTVLWYARQNENHRIVKILMEREEEIEDISTSE